MFLKAGGTRNTVSSSGYYAEAHKVNILFIWTLVESPTATLPPGRENALQHFQSQDSLGFHVRERGLSRGLDVWARLFGTPIVL